MRLHAIDVDEDVFQHLQSQAQPLVDTPNTVLRRLLLGTPSPGTRIAAAGRAKIQFEPLTDLPATPFGTPAALQQILWVTYLVRKNGRPRPDATVDVAKTLHVAPQTVLDKYCRQLGLTAMRFDLLLRDPRLTELRSLLLQKFPEYDKTIGGFLSSLHAAA
jgi:hypothetical protein